MNLIEESVLRRGVGFLNLPEIKAQLPVLMRVGITSAFGFERILGRGRRLRNWILKAARRYGAVLRTRPLRVTLRHGTTFVYLNDPRFFRVLEELHGDSDEFEFIKNQLHSGDSFVDIGANYGSFSLYATGIVGPTGTILAVEPQPNIAAALRLAFRETEHPQARLWEGVCSSSAGRVQIAIPNSNSGEAFVTQTHNLEVNNVCHVEAMTLDALVGEVSLTGNVIVKIDVEGHEVEVVKGGNAFLSRRKPDVIIEVNQQALARQGTSVAELSTVFLSLGYAWFAEMADTSEWLDLREMPATPERNVVLRAK